MEETNLRLKLDYAIAIFDNNNQTLMNQSDLEVERAKKNVEKAWRRQQRKITLAQVTSSTDISVLLTSVLGNPLSTVFCDDM